MSTDPTLKPDRTADWYMDVVWPLLPVPGEFDGMDACDQFRWRSVVRLAIEYVLCGERGVPPGSKTPHCPKGDGPCIRGCKNWECRDGWPEDRVTCGGGLPGDPNGEHAALAVEGLVRKYEGAMLRETLREALSEAYLMGAQNILGQLR